MTPGQKKAWKAFLAANKTGAPYTDPGHAMHDTMLSLEKIGKVRGDRRFAPRIYWGMQIGPVAVEKKGRQT